MSSTPEKPFPPETAGQVAEASGGYKIVWENPGENKLDASLHFKLLTPDNQLAEIEPYMGMAGHAVVRKQDGAVFAHIHPAGTFSMAAQDVFINGKPARPSKPPGSPDGSPAEKLSLAPELHSSHTNWVGLAGKISFPYAFPEPGTYRFWIQMKSKGRILTGVFDTTVAATK